MTPTLPRVRFAPAPTGYLHVGGARSALFNWLYARQTGGVFVLRVEDTNPGLSRPELIEAILEPLRWLGLDWDEGPIRQSERGDLYRDAIDRLLASGSAYRCDCTQDEVKARADERGGKPGYDGYCRTREVADGEGVVVRFRVPDDGVTAFDDVVRGHVEFHNADLEDFVIRRSDGTPVFLVANAVDDADMGMTHVIRGEDLLNTTPKVILLWQALGLGEIPVYAHLPLLVNEQRKKLSKRRDDVAMGDYVERGYLAEAMANYLATLGWGPPDGVEIRPMAEIVELFRLEDVTKGSAFFDTKKLDHFNSTYLRALPVDEFVERARPWLESDVAPWPPAAWDPGVFTELAPMVQERCVTLADAASFVAWLFVDEVDIDEAAWTKAMVKGKHVPEILDAVTAGLADCPWKADVLEEIVRGAGDALGARSQVPVRVAVTGSNVGIPLFEPLVLLGRERALARLRAARARLP